MVVKNILKYLRRTKDVFLIYGDGDLIVNGYSDANFQSDRNDSKSQSSYVFTLNVVQSIGRLPNNKRLQILQLKQSTSQLLKQLKKRFG